MDILVNKAAVARGLFFDDLTDDLWPEHLRLKLFGYLQRAVLDQSSFRPPAHL